MFINNKILFIFINKLKLNYIHLFVKKLKSININKLSNLNFLK